MNKLPFGGWFCFPIPFHFIWQMITKQITFPGAILIYRLLVFGTLAPSLSLSFRTCTHIRTHSRAHPSIPNKYSTHHDDSPALGFHRGTDPPLMANPSTGARCELFLAIALLCCLVNKGCSILYLRFQPLLIVGAGMHALLLPNCTHQAIVVFTGTRNNKFTCPFVAPR